MYPEGYLGFKSLSLRMIKKYYDEKATGIFQGCALCRKHCCLLRRDKTSMVLYISGREYEQIAAFTGNADHITTLTDGRIAIKCNENGYCPFVGKQGCTLGEFKPLPCKFYPYGIMLKNNIHYLIRWINICESFSDSNDQEEYDGLYGLIYPGVEKRAFVYNKSDEGNFVIVQKVPRMFLNDEHFSDAA